MAKQITLPTMVSNIPVLDKYSKNEQTLVVTWVVFIIHNHESQKIKLLVSIYNHGSHFIFKSNNQPKNHLFISPFIKITSSLSVGNN